MPKKPCVSVIIPVFNDPGGIKTTLDSFEKQTLTEQFEVIVVDNNSTDNTRQVVNQLITDWRNPAGKVRMVVEKQIRNPAASRNKGLKYAQADLISFIDADMWVNPGFLQKVLKASSKHNQKYLYMGNKVVTVVRNDSLVEKYNYVTAFPQEKYLNEKHMILTCGLTVNRNLVDKVGRFNDALFSSEDWEYGVRVHQLGVPQLFNPHIKMYHPARENLLSTLKKSFRIGRGLKQVTIKTDSCRPNTSFEKILPKNPASFRKKVNKKLTDVGEIEFWLMYILDYLAMNVVVAIGYLAEVLIPTKSNQNQK